MTQEIAIGITQVVVVGVVSQWIAWRFKLPSILVLLFSGFILGPVTGMLDPTHLFGEFLFPVVSLSVGIVLFEGGLSLRFEELGEQSKTVGNLVTIGVLVTWCMAAAATYYLTQLGLSLSLLVGAIFVVSGPTVIVPLLRFVRPVGRIGSIIKWEGIVNDPVGAVLAVLVFEAILAGELENPTNVIFLGILNTMFIGGGFGWLGAQLLIIPLKRYWIPDFLQNAVVLMVVVLTFTLSNSLQEDSGLLTVTVMAIVMANQKGLMIKQIIEFKENLGVLIIGSLFIVLAARLDLETIFLLGPGSLALVAFLILIVRPIAVYLSTFRSGLSWREKAFLAWMAPRGIVAAAVSALFALELEEVGFANAEQIVPLTFLVIVGTVTTYSLSAAPLGRWLKVARPNPQGVLLVGAHLWARQIAAILQEEGIDVLVVDNNGANIRDAQKEGLPSHRGNVLSDRIIEDIELGGVGRLLALTPNDEVNSLSALHFTEVFSRSEVYQLALKNKSEDTADALAQPLRGRCLFQNTATYTRLERKFQDGAYLKKFSFDETFTFAKFKETCGEKVIPMFIIDEVDMLTIITKDSEITPRKNQHLIGLVDKDVVVEDMLFDDITETKTESDDEVVSKS